MDIPTLTAFFMWCSIINGGFIIFVAAMCMGAPDFMYRTQTRWFPITRETFNVAIYAFLGLFKIFFLVFNIVPYLALLIIG